MADGAGEWKCSQGKGQELSPSGQRQSKTLDIILCIRKFMSRVEAGFEKCGLSSFIAEHLFFAAEGLPGPSCLRQSLKNMVPCLLKLF